MPFLRNISISDDLKPIVTIYEVKEIRDRFIDEVKLERDHIAQRFECMMTDAEFYSSNPPILRCNVYDKDKKLVCRVWYQLNRPSLTGDKEYYSYDLYFNKGHATIAFSDTPAKRDEALKVMAESANQRILGTLRPVTSSTIA